LLTEGDTDGDALKLIDGDMLADGLTEGETLGDIEGLSDGDWLGLADALGEVLGEALGDADMVSHSMWRMAALAAPPS
jgi:hypothetical protein